MRWSLYLGKIAGIRLFVHWTFLILIGWVLLANFQQGKAMEDGLMTLVFLLAVFTCVTLHELGHALTAKKYNITTRSITLLPIGGLANMEKLPENPWEEMKVAIAGPLVNVVIAVLLYLGIRATGGIPPIVDVEQATDLTGRFFWVNLLVVNALLAGFNLIPAFPMDGGRVLRALLSVRMSRTKATDIAAGVGQFLAILFIFGGIFYNFWLIFIGLFVFLGANAESVYQSTTSVLSRYTVRDVLMHQYTALSPYDNIDTAIKALLDGQDQEFLVKEGNKVMGVLTRDEIIQGLNLHGGKSFVNQVMRTDFKKLAPDTPLNEIYYKMLQDQSLLHPVFEGDELVGVLDRSNIQEFLMVNEVLSEQEKKSSEVDLLKGGK